MPPSTDALQELISLAESLGLAERGSAAARDGAEASSRPQQEQPTASNDRQQPTDCSSSGSSCAALEADDAARALCDARLSSLAAARAAAARDPCGARALAGRAARAARAAGALERTVTSKHAIADRLRASKLRPSAPVAPDHQPAFSSLLAAAAGGGPMLEHGAAALGWAAALDADPSCWEDTLRSIPDGARACRAHLRALSEFSASLAAAAGREAAAGAAAEARGARGTAAAAPRAAV